MAALGYANYDHNSISAIIGFPYNPYHPKPYARFSTQIFDKEKDILIQEKFWNAIAGFDVYDDLIKTVQKVGDQNQKNFKNGKQSNLRKSYFETKISFAK